MSSDLNIPLTTYEEELLGKFDDYLIIQLGQEKRRSEYQKRVLATTSVNMQQIIETIKEENIKLREENQFLKSGMTSSNMPLYKVIQILGERIVDLESASQVTDTTALIDQGTLHRLSNENEMLKREIQEKEQKICNLEKNSKERDFVHSEKIKEYDQLNSINNITIQNLEKTVEKQDEIKFRYERTISVLQLKLEDAIEKNDKYIEQIRELEQNFNAITYSLEDAVKMKTEYEKQIDSLRNKNKAISEEMRKMVEASAEHFKTLPEENIKPKELSNQTTKKSLGKNEPSKKKTESQKKTKKKDEEHDPVILSYQVQSMTETIKKLENDIINLQKENAKLENDKTILIEQMKEGFEKDNQSGNKTQYYTETNVGIMEDHIHRIEETLGNIIYYMRDVKSEIESGKERNINVIYQDIISLLKQSEGIFLTTDGNLSICLYNKLLGV